MKIALALVLLGRAASADVVGELSAGGGGDTTAPGGFATTTASLAARYDQPAAPLERRGFYVTDPDGSDKEVWLFTGLDRDDRDSVGASGDATAHVMPQGDPTRAAWFAGRAWARGLGWQCEVRGAFQPVGDLRDRFWRSGRGILQSELVLAGPGLFAVGSREVQVAVAAWSVDLGHRQARVGDGWSPASFDREVDFDFAHVQTPRAAVDVLAVHYAELGVITQDPKDSANASGTSVTAIDLDVLSATVRPRADVSIAGRAGLAMRMPLAPFQIMGTSETSTGPVSTTPAFWLEASYGRALDPLAHGLVATLGGGSWSRLDPTGHAVDTGELVAASTDWRDGRWRLGGALELGRLRRTTIGDLAPGGLTPLGTERWMGRGSLLAAVRVTPELAVESTAWLERSDRDDPRWLVPATGALTTHAGADVTARWRFRRL